MLEKLSHSICDLLPAIPDLFEMKAILIQWPSEFCNISACRYFINRFLMSVKKKRRRWCELIIEAWLAACVGKSKSAGSSLLTPVQTPLLLLLLLLLLFLFSIWCSTLAWVRKSKSAGSSLLTLVQTPLLLLLLLLLFLFWISWLELESQSVLGPAYCLHQEHKTRQMASQQECRKSTSILFAKPFDHWVRYHNCFGEEHQNHLQYKTFRENRESLKKCDFLYNM